jgi:short-subunit dehydrogenase
MNLENKIAVITGISKGIGKSITEQLLAKDAIVVGWGMNKPGIIHKNLHFFEVDIRDSEMVEDVFKKTQQALGPEIHILINNAGLGYFGYFEDMPIEEFREIFEVNVFGIYHTCRHVIPLMKKQQYGHIINISSTAGQEGIPQVAAYCGAKHAVRGISESLYKELRDFGVKVTCVYPGSTKTDFFRNAPNIKPHDQMMNPDEVALQIIHALETSDNFLTTTIEFRPLQPKPVVK